MTLTMIVELLIVLLALWVGSRYGSLALGAISGIGLALLVLGFGLKLRRVLRVEVIRRTVDSLSVITFKVFQWALSSNTTTVVRYDHRSITIKVCARQLFCYVVV